MLALRSATMLLCAALLSGCVGGLRDDPMYWASQGAIAYDILCQTTDIQNHHDIRESNPLMSSNPSNAEAAAYFVGAAVLNHFVYRWIKQNHPAYRHAYGAAITGMQAYYVRNNHALGLNCW